MARRRRRATERLWLLRKFVTVDSAASESTSGRRKRSWKRLWLEWPSWYPLGLTFVGSLATPSTKSRTRTSLNFGKTNIVSQFAFHLIFVLLQLFCRFSVYIVISSRCLQFGLKIEIERIKFGAALQKSCIPDTSGIRAQGWILFDLCSNFVLQGCSF